VEHVSVGRLHSFGKIPVQVLCSLFSLLIIFDNAGV
jgi:hypothetical protein